jgi:hypothetical protein
VLRLRETLAAASLVILGAVSAQAFTTPPLTFPFSFAGVAHFRGDGFRASQPYALQVSLDADARIFLAMDGNGRLYGGHLVPKGERGRRLSLVLDAGSSEVLAADLAARAAAASGHGAGRSILGQSAKLVLSSKEDGSPRLRIQSEVLVDGVGVVVFKANLSGVEATSP